MKDKDFKVGEIYTGVSINGKDLFIWECGSEGKKYYSHRIYIGGGNAYLQYSKNDHFYWDNNRLSTPQEISWLQMCKNAGKSLNKSDIQDTFYEIY